MTSKENFICGRNPVLESLKSGASVKRIVVLAGTHGRVVDEIKALASKRRVSTTEIGKEEFNALTNDPSTQGIIAFLEPIVQTDLASILQTVKRKNEAGFLLILDEIEDPQNLGALIRSAECTGVHGVVIPKHHSASVNSTVVKASAGATAYVPVAEVTNIATTIKQLKEDGYWVTGLDANADQLFSAVDYKGPVAIVVGSEGRGIRRLVREQCDFLVSIPLRGRIESLNASVAGALVMYEVLRQRALPKNS